MKRLLLAAAVPLALLMLTWTEIGAQDKKDGWVQLFNGKDLTGWKTHPKSPGKWYVKDGAITSGGVAISHLFSERDDYENFHFRIEAKVSDKGNSGQYFRTKFGAGYPKGYEAQINSTHGDQVRTGSLYNFVRITDKEGEKLGVKIPPDTWFTQEVVAVGNKIRILVNGKETVSFEDKKNTHTKGHFALQQHDAPKTGPETVLQVKKIEVKELPATK